VSDKIFAAKNEVQDGNNAQKEFIDASKAGQPVAQLDNMQLQEMVKYGITSIPMNYFYIGGFRYTNPEDAIAQAKRTTRR
jgi:hypothetical protein